MSNKQIVETVFKGKDRITAPFRRMGKGADKFGNSAEKAFKNQNINNEVQDTNTNIGHLQHLGARFRGNGQIVRTIASPFLSNLGPDAPTANAGNSWEDGGYQ